MKKVFILFILFILSVAVALGIVVNEQKKKNGSGAYTRFSSSSSSAFSSPAKSSSSSSSLTSSYIAPALPLTVTSPKNNSTVNTASIAVEGKTAPGASVIVNDAEFKADASGNFSRSLSLDEGENYISIVAYTDAGDVSEMELMVVRE